MDPQVRILDPNTALNPTIELPIIRKVVRVDLKDRIQTVFLEYCSVSEYFGLIFLKANFYKYFTCLQTKIEALDPYQTVGDPDPNPELQIIQKSLPDFFVKNIGTLNSIFTVFPCYLRVFSRYFEVEKYHISGRASSLLSSVADPG